MQAADQKYDSLYLTVAQSAGSVDAILESFFSFLARKTDFFARPDLAKDKVDECLARLLASKTEQTKTPKIEEIPDSPPATAPSKQPVAAAASASSATGAVPTINGGVTDRYSWTQTLAVVDVVISLPAGVRARDLVVEVGVDSLLVALKGKAQTLLEGKMHAKVKDSTWTVDGGTLQISLENRTE